MKKDDKRRNNGHFQKGVRQNPKSEFGQADSGHKGGRIEGVKNKATIAKERVFMDNKKLPGENMYEYVSRGFEEGWIDALAAPGLAAKVMDKETPNSPVVQVVARLEDQVTKEEMTALFQKAGVIQLDEKVADAEIIIENPQLEDDEEL